MVGNRNHPLDQQHYAEHILEDYVLGQLLPAEEAEIQQHVADCPLCQATVNDLRAFCQRLSADLHYDLDQAAPGPALDFDQIADQWRTPPRISLFHKLQQFVPSASYAVLVILLVAAFVVLISSSRTRARQSLDLINEYQGPPTVIAVMTGDGLAVVELAHGTATVRAALTEFRSPRNLQLSPDGQWLAFQERSTLNIIQTTHAQEQIRVPVTDTADWSWSRDSQQLAYTNGQGQLAIFEVRDQSHRVLVPANEFAWGLPVWSDDGQQLAYAVVSPLPSADLLLPADTTRIRQSIWRVTLATGYRVELARNPVPDERLLVPADWNADQTTLLAWDINASAGDRQPQLYRIDVYNHALEPLESASLAQGTRLAWPVNGQDVTLVWHHGQLTTASWPVESTITAIPAQIPWPDQQISWSPNGAWLAYTVTGTTDGQGVYVYAPQEAALRSLQLPTGASEKAVYWGGSEFLFVIRQPQNDMFCELWLVMFTSDAAPVRIMTNLSLPRAGDYNGWSWQDVLALQVLG